MNGSKITWYMRKVFLVPMTLYRKLISPLMKPRCIYYPSCSEYFGRSVMKYGILKGSMKGFYRVLRCNPFAAGGYDPP
jgi:hypothetical protein